jgi:hypothetical protein
MSHPQYLLFQLRELACDAKIGKDRHFIAADRKQDIGKRVGLWVVIINVSIGSTFFSSFKSLLDPQVITSAFSFLAAALAGIGTYFNFSKDVENHRKVGNLYLSISRRTNDLLASYRDGFVDRNQLKE